jgi:uncharacterized protein YjbI with pentapeptide repeats
VALVHRKRSKLEQQLRQAIVTGELVDRRTGQAEADDPAQGATWKQQRTVRAELLAELLIQHREGSPRPRALRLAGARITGVLDLEGAELVCPLLLRECWFDEPLTLAEAQAAAVRLPGCHLPALLAAQLVTRGNLELDEGFIAQGEVNLLGSHIGGTLSFSGATLANPDGHALTAEGLTVGQRMFCRDGFTAQGDVQLRGAHIGGPVVFSGAMVNEGEVNLRGAHIEGTLDLAGATLRNPRGYALNAERLAVDESVVCLGGLTAEGAIDLMGAQIGGTVDFSGAALANSSGSALDATGLRVGQDVICTQGFTAYGEVCLHSANIGGRLDFRGATLTNPDGEALYADGLTVDHDMFCSEGFVAQGEIRLPGAHIGGQLDLSGATLINPSRPALTADGLTVDQGMLCREGFTTQGEIRLPGARISGTLSFTGATLTNPNGPALNLYDARIQTLFLNPAIAPSRVDLRQAKVGVLHDDQATWPEGLRLVGFTYDELAERRPTSAKERLGWLRRDLDGYSPQPYEQLAAIYRRAGREEDARRVAIAKQRQRRLELSWPARLWSLLLGALVGHGYRTWYAVGWLLLWLAVGTLIYQQVYPGQMRPATPGAPGPAFQPIIYARDVLLPVADLDQQAHWIPEGLARWWTWASILAGWVLTTAVVAALTGLLKRE